MPVAYRPCPRRAKPLTQEGSILGTFQYMAPEQLEGKEADARTDIFAFGAVLYEMVTGKRAFEPGERKVLLQGGSFPNYVSTGQLVYNRTGTLMAVPFDLDRLGISGSPVPVIEGIRSPIAVLGGADFAISRTGTLADIAGSAEESASRLVWVDRQGVAEPSSAPPRNYEFPRVSPDGQRVAAGIREDETHIWVYDILRTTLTRQTFGGGLNTAPAWSPDGKVARVHLIPGRSLEHILATGRWRRWRGTVDDERLSNCPGFIFPGRATASVYRRQPGGRARNPGAESRGSRGRDVPADRL